MTTLYAISILGIAIIGLIFQQKRIFALHKKVRKKEEGVEKTSKLLMEKNVELLDQNIRLQKLLEAKEDFIGIASHQLRTPITEIKWSLESILGENKEVKTISGKKIERLKKTHESADKMIRLIEDLLRLVHSEAGYGEYNIEEEHNIEDAIRNIIKTTEKRFAEKNIRVEKEFTFGKECLLIDKETIETTISNFIENAFNYTQDNGLIKIITKKTDGSFYFEVSDNGIGIPAHKQRAIFQKFQRANVAMQMNSGGIGLGLYTAKNIIEHHRGTVGFASEEGKGSRFYFTLPITKKKVETAQPPRTEALARSL